MRRANCRSGGQDEVTGAHLLVGVFSERNSKATAFLATQGITRSRVVKVLLEGGRVPDLGRALEATLRRAAVYADAKHYMEPTLEHLLLALLDDPDASDALIKSGADIENLRSAIAAHLDAQSAERFWPAKSAGSLERVVRRAVAHIRALGRSEVTGANVLVEVLSEAGSWAVGCLAQHGIGRLQVVLAIVEHRDDLKEPS
jgi:ATP-dependent Clp protease ATP-binding subunit ClpA